MGFTALCHRLKIVKEKALPDIENYMFENHDQLRQAATECMCNLVVNKEVKFPLGMPNLSACPWPCEELSLTVIPLGISGAF